MFRTFPPFHPGLLRRVGGRNELNYHPMMAEALVEKRRLFIVI
jgi:hypothetical protein